MKALTSKQFQTLKTKIETSDFTAKESMLIALNEIQRYQDLNYDQNFNDCLTGLADDLMGSDPDYHVDPAALIAILGLYFNLSLKP